MVFVADRPDFLSGGISGLLPVPEDGLLSHGHRFPARIANGLHSLIFRLATSLSGPSEPAHRPVGLWL